MEKRERKAKLFQKPEEIQTVKEIIAQNPTNLGRAFVMIGEKFNVSPGTVANHWYVNKKSPIYKGNIGTCFMTVGVVDNIVGAPVFNNIKNM